MRILYLTNGFPWPLTSGYLRHYHLMRELSQRHELTLLSLAHEPISAERAAPIREFAANVQTFVSGRNGTPRRSRAVRGLRKLTGIDAGVRAMRNAAAEINAKQSPDVVFFSGKRTLPVLRALPGIPIVADMCDVASVRYRGRMKHARLIEQPWNLAAYSHIRHVERSIVRSARHIFFASRRDREAIFGSRTDRASVVPNGVDIDFWKRSHQARGEQKIVFTGAMHYRPNVDAALFLIRNVLPLVHREIPQAELFIVGRDPTPELAEAGRADGVTVTGFVDDVRPYLEQASAFAAPLRFGAGIQNKVLEAMAMEVPTIASAIAADGLRTEEGCVPPLEVADGEADFAARIVAKLNEQKTRPAADTAARDYVAKHFVWKRSAELVEAVLENVTGLPIPGEPQTVPSFAGPMADSGIELIASHAG